jgi:hypothetical protein
MLTNNQLLNYQPQSINKFHLIQSLIHSSHLIKSELTLFKTHLLALYFIQTITQLIKLPIYKMPWFWWFFYSIFIKIFDRQ